MGQRYTWTLSATAKDKAKPDDPPDMDMSLTWDDVPYEGFVALNKELVKVLENTTEWGVAIVDSRGGKLPGPPASKPGK